MPRASGEEARATVVARAIDAIADCDFADLLRFLTPDALADGDHGAPLPGSTVRYLFRADGTTRFDRSVLAEAILRRISDDFVAGAAYMAGEYAKLLASSGPADAGQSLTELFERHLQLFDPAADHAPQVAGRERAFYLAVAMCDDDRILAARLRSMFDAIYGAFQPIIDSYLERSGRTPAEGTMAADLPVLVGMLIEGIVLRRRFDGTSSLRVMAVAIVRALEAWTNPVESAGPRAPQRASEERSAFDAGSPEATVRTLEGELALTDPFGPRGLELLLRMLDQAPRSSVACARAMPHARRIVARPAVRDTVPGTRAWVAAAEIVAMADGDRPLAGEAADLALEMPFDPQEPGELLAALRHAWLLLRLERFADAGHQIRRTRETWGDDPPDAGFGHALEAYRLLHVGPVDAAIAKARDAVAGHGLAREFGAAMLARALVICGRPDEAAAVVREVGLSSPPNLGTTQFVLARGVVALERRRTVEAVEELLRVPAHLRRIGSRNPSGWPWLVHAVRALVLDGRTDRARGLIDEYAPHFEAWGTPGVTSELLWCRSLVADRGDADDLRRRSVAVLAGTEARVTELRMRWHLERSLGQPLSPDGAGLGIAPPHARARGVLSDLSPRVREVADLVAQGLRDREIAERLGISTRTAENHVRAALRLTGSTTRSELAARVARATAERANR